jgi:hypothetical protein
MSQTFETQDYARVPSQTLPTPPGRAQALRFAVTGNEFLL